MFLKHPYVVATVKPWNLETFHRHRDHLPGNWHLITNPKELTPGRIKAIRPRYIFFPHWSWKVPAEILESAECVCFHMTDLPYGRGGSPLQNLISRGHRTTKLSALRMVDAMDAGPIYAKRDLSLSGSAEDIFRRCAEITFEMIAEITESTPEPMPQLGEVVTFKRRKPEESAIIAGGTLDALYDQIRMLDAETYPRAYLEHGDFRIEFRNAELTEDEIEASVVITRRNS